MEKWELIAPCHFGMEAVLKREILDLGYEISKVEDGKVTFIGDAEAVCRANIFLRKGESVNSDEKSQWRRNFPNACGSISFFLDSWVRSHGILKTCISIPSFTTQFMQVLHRLQLTVQFQLCQLSARW